VRVSRGTDGVEISVSDEGPGVPADKRAEVVKRFVRLDKSRSKPGTGLGLSLVEAIMALHGGRLQLTDTRSHADYPGLTATMVFPGMRS
jgi:signal transduction histidine kinase